MVDSIRPFVALIRTLSRKKVEEPDGVAEPSVTRDAFASDAPTEGNRGAQLETRLRVRLAAVDGANPTR